MQFFLPIFTWIRESLFFSLFISNLKRKINKNKQYLPRNTDAKWFSNDLSTIATFFFIFFFNPCETNRERRTAWQWQLYTKININRKDSLCSNNLNDNTLTQVGQVAAWHRQYWVLTEVVFQIERKSTHLLFCQVRMTVSWKWVRFTSLFTFFFLAILTHALFSLCYFLSFCVIFSFSLLFPQLLFISILIADFVLSLIVFLKREIRFKS